MTVHSHSLEVCLDALASLETDSDMVGGEVESPSDWFAKVIITPESLDTDWVLLDGQVMEDHQANINKEDLLGIWLVRNDSQGFIHVEHFPSEDDLDVEFKRLMDIWNEWMDEPDGDGEEASDAP